MSFDFYLVLVSHFTCALIVEKYSDLVALLLEEIHLVNLVYDLLFFEDDMN